MTKLKRVFIGRSCGERGWTARGRRDRRARVPRALPVAL